MSKFKLHLAHLGLAESLWNAKASLEGVPPAKVANFASDEW